MDITNETPFAVATMLWEDLEGEPKLTLITKGTFAIESGERATFAGQAISIFTADVHWADDPARTVRCQSDVVPFKSRADVVLVGRAVAPGGRPVTRLDVAIRVGGLQKVIRLFGNRWWFSTKPALGKPWRRM